MRYRWMTLLVLAAFALMGAKDTIRVLRPSMAGVFYPAEKEELKKAIDKCCEPAEVLSTPPAGRIVAMIVPHASLQMSGNIAGSAFRLINPGDFDKVIVISPTHFASFRGCSIPSVQVCRTPLGDIPLDGPTIGKLDLSPLIDLHAVYYGGGNPDRKITIHENEYSLEAILPFLQVRLGSFKIIPILSGDFLDLKEHPDPYTLRTVAKTIKTYVTERTLIVVSSDLTHYGDRFKHTPFSENIEEGIEKLDKEALELILDRNFDGFLNYMTQTENVICGMSSIAIMLKLLPPDAQGTLLQYDTSARITGKKDSSISFASVVFTQPGVSSQPTPSTTPAASSAQEKQP